MSMERSLRSALAAQALRELDLHFALYVARLAGNDEAVVLASALVSLRTGEGHVCVALDEFAGTLLFTSDTFRGIEAPALDKWRASLRNSGVVGHPGDFAPLILDNADRLYLARYFHFERAIAERLIQRARAPLADFNAKTLRAALDRHFPQIAKMQEKCVEATKRQLDLWDAPSAPNALPPLPMGEGWGEGVSEPANPAIDHQRLAAATALLRPLAVIAGGPGTGKTTTVTRLLALLIEQSWPKVPRIALAAPTGKAAARLSESVKAQKSRLNCAAEIRDALPDEASTLHRLLKAVPGRTGFRHDARNPLHLDVLVVDEVSMVDVPTMARLLDALPAEARLILLGDPDQLASVEAGSVLGDICNRELIAVPSPSVIDALHELGVELPAQPSSPSPLADSRVVLERSRRFGSDSGIGQLARAINAGDATTSLALLNERRGDLVWRELEESAINNALSEKGIAEYAAYLSAPDAASALATFNRFRFLCALREGAFGVDEVNRVVEQALRRRHLIKGGERFYTGRPILITRNDYTLGLFNGDIGMVWPDDEGRLRAFFAQPDGSLKRVLLARLPEHETVFAMTIHKSQGSEFDRCVVVLPDRDAPLLTRELAYTGITRAREAVELWSSRATLLTTLQRRITRRSGLREALWGEQSKDRHYV